MTDAPLLELEGVTASYGEGQVVHDASAVVRAGEVVCVLGPNGAGKTTLLRAISGVVPHVGGTVRFEGRPIGRLRPHRRVRLGIVHVPEGRRTVIPTMTVADNLRLAGRHGDAGLRDEVEELFPVLGERRDQQAGSLSGGQQQMLAIGLGLMLWPRVLLVDEPSAGLAPIVVDEVFERLQGLRQRGIAMLLAEQRVDLALALADRGYIMETGRVVAAGRPDELRASPVLASSYLGSR